MLEYIYVTRHGFRTNWTNSGLIKGPTGVIRDFPLTVYGHTQAAALGGFLSSPEQLAPHPVPERVVSSPFIRCVHTAAPAAAALGTPIGVEHGVMEYYGTTPAGTGLHPRPAANGAADLEAYVPPGALDTGYTSTLYPSRHGERVRDLHARAALWADAFVGRMEAEGVRSVAVVSHAAVVIALGRVLTGDDSLQVSAACAATSLYRRRPGTLGRAGDWERVYDGRADYLPNGAERDWSWEQVGIETLDDGDAVWLPVGLAPGMERFLAGPAVVYDPPKEAAVRRPAVSRL
ncbi:C6 zinc cluster transcription factor-like protein [Vanrija albida]|uniref:C6 zinc cluster transcription factor-like protein n=1 Tax=Vanrija albida TaxID=181172 RepID=A0ABR3Q2D6_9TREE